MSDELTPPADAPVPSSNPLAGLHDDVLWNGQILLAILCNRNKFASRKQRSYAMCAIQNALAEEAAQRGQAAPGPPHSTGRLRNLDTA